MQQDNKAAVLLFMPAFNVFYYRSWEDLGRHIRIVEYEGDFVEEDIKQFFDKQGSNIDIVLALSMRTYDESRSVMERVFEGPKVLLHTVEMDNIPNKDLYVGEIYLVDQAPHKRLDKIIERHVFY